jgi:hypothetical protein
MMSESQSPSAASVTESPWFWVMLFSLAGLAAVVTVGPKFEQREEGIEEKFHARERAMGREAFDKIPDDGATPDSQPEAPWPRIFTLGPIAAVLMCIAAIGMFNIFRLQRKRLLALQREEGKPPAPPALR